MTGSARVDWRAPPRDAPAQIQFRFRPGDWPSGLYFLRITASDGRLGYAPAHRSAAAFSASIAVPFVLRDPRRGRAYNFTDANGDGLGRLVVTSGGRTAKCRP